MARLTAAEAAAKWSQRSTAAAADYTAGVQRVTTAPGVAAAAAAQTWQTAVASPDALAKYRNNVALVSLQDWQNAATQYGSARYAQGVAAKQSKYENIIAQVLAYQDQILPTIKRMDKSTFAARVQRSVAWQNAMHNFKRTS